MHKDMHLHGKSALSIARKAIDLWVKKKERLKPEKYPHDFDRNSGVFVTIHTYPLMGLRGCIGYPEPVMPLIDALIESAIEATKDPRFMPLKKEELGEIVLEVSVLTPPQKIEVSDPSEYPRKIRIGRDGLIARKGYYSGLLLPQVATDHRMNQEEFLEHTCSKAGLSRDEWRDGSVEIYSFQAHIFSEKSPPKARKRK